MINNEKIVRGFVDYDNLKKYDLSLHNQAKTILNYPNVVRIIKETETTYLVAMNKLSSSIEIKKEFVRIVKYI
jgi:hypothetical protein